MDAILSELWLEGLEPSSTVDEASVVVFGGEVRGAAAALSLPAAVMGSLVNIASELGHNQLAHAKSGRMAVQRIARAGVPGLEIVAADAGDGISDPRAALQGGPRLPQPGRGGLGVGLAAVLELADEVDFDVRLGEGMCIRARRFADAVPRRRQIGIYGRPYPGERVSGDFAAFVRKDESLLLAVADGLGHGPEAREASGRAVEALLVGGHPRIDAALEACHGALAGTRGAVMTAALLEETGGQFEVASAGNVGLHLYGPQGSRRILGPPLVLGGAGNARRPSYEVLPLGPRDALILFSDGLTPGFDLESDIGLFREHPIVAAHELAQRFARANDDVLVLVAG